jgi:predicted ribosomally synthesized peptide with nif11-like leader
MSIEEADRFIADIRANPEKFDDLEAMGREGEALAVFEKVQAMGYDATGDEIREAFLEYISEELDAEQLEAVAGGLSDGGIIGATAGAAVGVGVAGGVAIATVVVATSSAAAAAAI